jgi:hypothetical protein
VARYRDAAANLSFYLDYDQRHTFNAYLTYRLRPSLNLSAKYRYGSNFPIVGFLKLDGGQSLNRDSMFPLLPIAGIRVEF